MPLSLSLGGCIHLHLPLGALNEKMFEKHSLHGGENLLVEK